VRRAWVAALLATLLMQTVGSFINQLVPVVAPLMTADLGLAPQMVGNFSSLNTLGAILFLMFGTPLVARFGPARTLQMGAMAACCALLLAAAGLVWALPLAALLMGIGYGPTGPAGSRILQAAAPPRHRVLIFSVKQAGAPLGGALAGLVAAPVAALFGWKAALLTGIAFALLAALTLQPLRPGLDSDRDPSRPLGESFTWRRLGVPVMALRLSPVLPPLCLQAFAFASLQGTLMSFTATWLVEVHGLALTAAGTVFAVMLVAGVIGRLALGWAADRVGDATRSLSLHGLVAASLAALWIGFGPSAPWPLTLLLAAGAGFTAASWNGIFLAEVARVVPADRVAEASAGAIMLCFLGYLTAPTAFAFTVGATGSWTLPYFAACALLAVISTLVGFWHRRVP
jgi:MFS family permease